MVFHFRKPRRWILILAAILLAPSGLVFAQDAPVVTLEPPKGAVRAGEPFEVGISASWAGESARFKVSPGDLTNPAWGEAAWTRVEARKVADQTVQTFFAQFVATEPGAVAIPALRLTYTDTSQKADAGGPVSNQLQVEGFDLKVKADYRWAYPYIALAVVVVGLGVSLASIWYGRRKAMVANAPDPLAPWRTVEESLHNARRHRLDGDFYAYYREQLRIVQFVGGEVKSEFKPWGSPTNWRDPQIGLNKSPHGFGGPWKGGMTNLVMADGSVRPIHEDIDPVVLKALSTPAAGDEVKSDY